MRKVFTRTEANQYEHRFPKESVHLVKIRAIAVAGMCLAGLAACSSATSTSALSSTATSHPAVASSPSATTAATTPAAAVAPPTSPLPATTQATTPAAQATAQAALAPPTPGTATIATLWCGAVHGVINAPTIATWESGSYGYDDAFVDTIPQIKGTVAELENANTAAATEAVMGSSLCAEVQAAEEEPPPVDQAMYASAMSDFLQASKILHSGGGYPAGGQAISYLNSGLAGLNAFLTAIGK